MPTSGPLPEHTRHVGDPRRVAIVLPGGMYTPAAPLLYYATSVLLHRGWTVQEIWWVDPPGGESNPGWVREQTEAALSRERADQVLLIGKSLGTYAAPVAAAQDISAIWLTPILTNRTVVDGIARASKPHLVVGGTADRVWRGEVARASGAEVLEIPDADHALEIEDDPIQSVRILGQITEAVDQFVVRL